MALPTLSLNEQANPEMNVVSNSIQLVHHATLVIRLGPYKLLVDPMLSARARSIRSKMPTPTNGFRWWNKIRFEN